ncbi:MAG: hypothetical protein ACTHVE_03260 [Senegalia sp. (in: firmicutes)]|uniref:hypothetical protein n=1 Tax=Senegalia sp. (in: firmicutes) TaxID=1924098 RepID=UPI003F94E4AC
MNWIKKFMIGRYGPDQLSTALLVLYIIFSGIFHSTLLNILSMVLLIIIFYRMFSKDIGKRYEENNKFLKYWHPIKNKARKKMNRMKSRKDYRYYECLNCKQKLRVPRGKGKITVTCPKCKITMIKKT